MKEDIMSDRVIENWLRQRNQKKARSLFLGGLALLPIGMCLSALSYVAVVFFAATKVEQNELTQNIFSFKYFLWIFIILTAIYVIIKMIWKYKHSRIPKLPNEYIPSEEDREEWLFLSFFNRGMPYFDFSDIHSNNSEFNAYTICVILLFVGPALYWFSLEYILKSLNIIFIDVRSCSTVLALMHRYPKRLPFAYIKRNASGVDLKKVLPQLALIDGVVCVESKSPVGLALNTDLRQEMENI
jgi:hypothetical protein